MTRQPHRLPAETRHGFGGGAIDRSRPLTFRLDGQIYEAFEGDTVLSAVLAAGVDTAGVLNRAPMGLDERLAPAIASHATRADPAAWLPMDRRLVRGGDDLVTIGPRAGLVRWAPALGRLWRRRTLGLKLSEREPLEPAWASLNAAETIEVDTVVVGGGIAGMSAALAAADAGDRVMLVEQRSTLGGDARYFGRVGDEEAPEERIAQLAARIAERDAISVRTCAEALVLRDTRVLVHEAREDELGLRGRVVRLVARRVILATGSAERLPVFPGNRLPGVFGTVTAFNRAERFGLWAGRATLVATPQSFAYRVALLASDAGIDIRRVVDTRPAPQSRFIDFAKATGITLASGLMVSAAQPRRGRQLGVQFAVSIEGATGVAEEIAVDLLIAAGGWQPRIGLWLMAGGHAAHVPESGALAARGAVDGVRLAGAAAGFVSSAACVASAERALENLLGRTVEPVEETLVDAVYETPAAPTPIAPLQAGSAPAYLDGGTSFTARQPSEERTAMAPIPKQFRPLSVADVAAAVATGSIPAHEAAIVAAERCLRGSAVIVDTGWQPPGGEQTPSDPAAPEYLTGRFGRSAGVVRLVPDDGRRLEVGCLLYAGSEVADPEQAIGVVLGPDDETPVTRVLGDRRAITDAPLLFVRDISGPVPVALATRRRERPGAGK